MIDYELIYERKQHYLTVPQYSDRKLCFGNESIVKAQIWDTAGQERYRSVTKAYYKGEKGALLVYDITRRNTFDNVDNWLIDLKTNGDRDILIILISNKSDLAENREVSVENAK